MTSERVMRSLHSWRPGRICSAQLQSWCIALTRTAPCAWLRSCGARADRPNTFPFIFWKTELGTSGGGNQVKRQKKQGEDWRVLSLFLLPFSFCFGLMVARDGIEPPTPAFSG